MSKNKINKIFIKNDLLENLERSKKGILGSDLKLKLENGLTYQLVPAVKFKERLAGKSHENLEGKFFTYEELSVYKYDIYMDTAIIDDETVYSFEEGFSGTLISSEIPQKNTHENSSKINNNTAKNTYIKEQINKSKEEHKKLIKTVESIQNILDATICDCHNFDILLEHFMKILGIHLKRENDFLYNDFKDNKKLQSLTKIYLTSMDLINTLITDYYNKWNSAEITTDNKDIFIDETKDIIKILKDKIKQEEEVLFKALMK